MVDTIRVLEKSILEKIGIPVSGYVAARFIQPDGLLLRFNASEFIYHLQVKPILTMLYQCM